MIIAHNLIAMNASNQLKKTNNDKSKSMEKLSSGMRINKASDNSAGLAISEKMRAQIRGLQQAERNIQDGISLIQTAEGGLANIENPDLQRLRELAIQSSNDTLTDEDRQRVQEEAEQLKQGINEIANNTEFNGIKLLCVPDKENSNFEPTPSVIDLSKATGITIYERTDELVNLLEGGQAFVYKAYELNYTIDDLVSGQTWSTPDKQEKYYFSVDLKKNTFTTKAFKSEYEVPLNNITGVRVNGLSGYDSTTVWGSNIVSVSGTPGDPWLEWNESENKVDEWSFDKILGSDLSDSPGFGFNETSDTSITINFEARKELSPTSPTEPETYGQDVILQVGANSGDTFGVKLTDARTEALGIDDIDFSTREGAESAISKIDEAINKVSSERGKFGAYQNALEHVYNNVSNYGSNLTSSESRIRDADMSKEMMELTKANILGQASQAMLTQANNQPQAVLELIK